MKMTSNVRLSGLFALSLLATGMSTLQAAPITVMKIGTWTTTPNIIAGDPDLQDAGLQQGGRYVIEGTFDPDSTPFVLRNFGGTDYRAYNLNDPGTGSSFRIQIPMEGFDTAVPFIYDQNQDDHFFAGFAPQAEIHFTDAPVVPANFVGFEFEGNFEPGATGNFVEVFTQGATPNQVVQILRDPSFNIVVRSINSFADPVTPVAEAGPDQQYSAAQQTVTTDVNAFVDNDLGAGRSDGEDFLNYDWTQGGNPLTGTAATAIRPDARVVDDVNIAVGIADSGLTNTTDSASWQVALSEDLTGLNGGTDTMTLTYSNTGPLAEAGGAIQFDATLADQNTSGAQASDADLAVNASIAGFESITVDFSIDGSSLPGDPVTSSPTTVTNALNRTISLAQSGLANTTDTNTLDLSVTDFATANATDTAQISYNNVAPEANATAIAQGAGVLFGLTADDADLAANAIIAGFESIGVEILVDGSIDATLFFDDLITSGSDLISNADLLTEFGGGAHQFKVTVTDFAGLMAMQTISFDVDDTPVQVPVPAVPALLLIGLLGMALSSRWNGTRFIG